jgi:hypothetical protein
MLKGSEEVLSKVANGTLLIQAPKLFRLAWVAHLIFRNATICIGNSGS